MLIFGVLTALLETPKIASFYAPPNVLGSTVGFVNLGPASDGGGGLFCLVMVVLFLVVSFDTRVFPRSGTRGTSGSESDCGRR